MIAGVGTMDSARPAFLLVDGNNVLFAGDVLRRRRATSVEAARAELVQTLTDWSDDSVERIVLAFDGGVQSPRDEVRGRRIQIIYGGPGETADTVIERLALKYASTYRLTVASNDHAIRDLVEAAGAAVISAEGLLDRIEASKRQRAEWLRRHRRRD